MKPLDLRTYEKHPTLDAYRFGPSYTPYAIVAVDKRFTGAELAAEYWAATLQNLWHADRDNGAQLILGRARAEALHRFATSPHYDEDAQ